MSLNGPLRCNAKRRPGAEGSGGGEAEIQIARRARPWGEEHTGLALIIRCLEKKKMAFFTRALLSDLFNGRDST